jgi:hypothetical protein
LRELQEMPESRLDEMRHENWRMLDTQFTWDRFATQVKHAIESDASPPLGPEPLGRKLKLMAASVITETSVWRPSRFARHLYRSFSGRSKSDRTVLEPIGSAHGL